MGAVNTNTISLAAIRETTQGTIPSIGQAEYLEPNDISTYNSEITTVARAPISKDRMARKGTITDMQATIEVTQDTTASFLLEFLQGAIYSHWIERPAAMRTDVGVVASGVSAAPGYQGNFPNEATATAAIPAPTTIDWWQNSTTGTEWDYDGSVVAADGYQGQFASSADADANVTTPAAGDWWQNTTTGTEWVYDGSTVAATGYLGQYASETDASAAHPAATTGDWWQNTTTGTEWNYDGTYVQDPNYRGEYGSEAQATLAITSPQLNDWWKNTGTSTEWVYDGTQSADPNYLGQYADEAAATAANQSPSLGQWWQNTTTGTEWEYVGGVVTAPGYQGQFADSDAATAAVGVPTSGMWWQNTTTGTEWEYDGSTTTVAEYLGSYADSAAALAAHPTPSAGQWFDNTTTGTEWKWDTTVATSGYLGEYADSAAALAAHPTPSAGDWYADTTTNTAWDWDTTTSAFVDSGAAKSTTTPAFVDTNNSIGTTTTTVTTYWKDSGNTNGTTATQVNQIWGDTTRSNGTTSTTVTNYWKDSGNPIGTTPEGTTTMWVDSGNLVGTRPITTISNWKDSLVTNGTNSITKLILWKDTGNTNGTRATTLSAGDGGLSLATAWAAAPIANTLIYCRGFVNDVNNGLKVVASGSTTQLIRTTDAATLVAENGQSSSAVFVCGYQATVGDIQIDSTGNIVSTALDFTTLGIEIGSGLFIGGLAANTRFDGTGNYGLCRVREVAAHKIVLDKRPNDFTLDKGVGKTIHLYFGWFIKDVATDDALFKEHSFSFEATYPGVQDNGDPGYEYAKGHMVNTFEVSLPLSDKSESTLTTYGLDIEPITATRQGWTFVSPIFQEAYSTPNDFIRLRLQRADEYGLSTLFKECTVTLNNNAGGENVLGQLGAAFTNYGNFDVSTSFICVFTNPDIPKMIRNNCTVTMDFCIANNDAAFYFDIPTMTLGDGSKDFAVNEKVKISLSSTAFGDSEYGYQIGITFFPYLPSDKADACA